MIKKVMLTLLPIWIAMVLVLMVIDLECMYKVIVTFDSVDCFWWILCMFSLSIITAGVAIVPILMYNDFKE
jgi:hypothetical protein